MNKIVAKSVVLSHVSSLLENMLWVNVFQGFL